MLSRRIFLSSMCIFPLTAKLWKNPGILDSEADCERSLSSGFFIINQRTLCVPVRCPWTKSQIEAVAHSESLLPVEELVLGVHGNHTQKLAWVIYPMSKTQFHGYLSPFVHSGYLIKGDIASRQDARGRVRERFIQYWMNPASSPSGLEERRRPGPAAYL